MSDRAPKVGQYAPYDAWTGHGYGRLAGDGPVGSPQQMGGEYPYGSGEPDWEVDDDDDPLDPLERSRFDNAVHGAHVMADPLRYAMGIGDRGSFCKGSTRLDLSWLHRNGYLLQERIFNPSGRSNPNASRVSGITRGWAGRPDPPPWDDGDPSCVMSLEDIAAEQEEEMERVRECVRKIVRDVWRG